ncbi:hypothetical protein BG616_20205 [Bacillus subtilis]|nr:hypothetical protein BG616_20205 [Bacillus subtilis]
MSVIPHTGKPVRTYTQARLSRRRLRRLLITVLALFAVILVIMLFADATRPALLLTSLWFIGLFLIYRARGSKKRRI